MKIRYFDLAKRLSNKADYVHKIGSVVVKKNRILGTGYNKPKKTHPRSRNKYKTLHAELDSILGLSYEELDGAEIYVFRQTKNGKPAMSRPCNCCLELLKLAKIKKMYYTTNEGFKGEEV